MNGNYNGTTSMENSLSNGTHKVDNSFNNVDHKAKQAGQQHEEMQYLNLVKNIIETGKLIRHPWQKLRTFTLIC